ncbi:MAG: S8 family serine peptidase [Pseudomonadota bacterium]|nr:S8 family serine peptidase [Pseudomonadota bacterium]
MATWFDTIKAGEARKEFGGDGEGIVWAVVATGIDESHPHFQQHKNLDLSPPLRHADLTNPDLSAELSLQEALTDLHNYGTFVGALIAGEDSHPKAETISVAPKTKLISLKTLAEDGGGSEFAVLRALERILELTGDRPTIHGVTIPLSLGMNVNYAVGISPVSALANELVRRGVCVVASAGNRGFNGGEAVGVPYSITDPGNAELAITVGATHARAPHEYGASFFSSRGPTVDGRAKPDLLAPGERIVSAVPDRSLRDQKTARRSGRGGTVDQMDGTGMAAAIASGACAAMLSAFPRLIGNPLQLKRLLMVSAEDLGRDRYAQGAGLLDLAAAMRAAAGQPSSRPSAPTGAWAVAAPTTPHETAAKVPPENLEPHTISGPPGRRFAVALSFARDQRDYVTAVVHRLRRKGLMRDHIFFDEYWEAELSRPDLDLYLLNIYQDDAELLVPFFSRSYLEREWSGLEWRALRDVIKKKRADEVMPVFLEDASVPGLLSIDGSLRGGPGIDPEEIGDKIVRRLLDDRKRRRAAESSES